MTARARALMIAAAIALTAAGCTPTTGEVPTGASPSPMAVEDAGVVEIPPTAAAEAQRTALEAATAVMTAFARSELGADEWMDAMYPLLSQAGADAYIGTDPSRIPAHQVTGEGRVVEGSTEVALIVEVPTDAGLYLVSLSRTSTSGDWLADRIRPASP